MSEQLTKQVTGICAAVTERNGWTEFEIDAGSQYTTKLSTKLQPIIELGRAAQVGSQLAVWTYKESDGKENPHKPGTFFKNRYLEAVEVGGTQNLAGSVATPDASVQVGSDVSAPVPLGRAVRNEQRPPVLGGDKDRLIVRQVCIKAAAELVAGNLAAADHPALVAEDPALEAMKAAQRFETWIYRDIADVPFDARPDLSEHDQGIPF